MKAKSLAAAVALVLLPGATLAQPPSLPGLRLQVDQLMAVVATLQQDLATTQAQLAATQEELAAVKSNSVLDLDGMLLLTQDADGHDTVLFTGVNVQVVNGTGATDAANGRGNVILGYNTNSGVGVNRLGSHNLVLGDEQSYGATQAVVIEQLISNRNLALTVGGNMTTTVGANQSTSVGKDRSVAVGEDSEEAIGGSSAVNIGTDANTTVGRDMTTSVGRDGALSVSRDAQAAVGRNATVAVGSELHIEAGDELVTTVGAASNAMQANGDIQIEGRDIAIHASGSIDIKASGDLLLKGSKILEN